MHFTSSGLPQIGAVVNGSKPVTSMSFHEDGQLLFVASSEDSKLRVINCTRGTSDSPAIRCEREGVHVVEATHHHQCLLTAGKGSGGVQPMQRNAVTYMSLHDNKVLRRFRGHSEMVTHISMNPKDDTFLSSSKDRTVRLWTLQSAGCEAQMKLPAETVGDPIAFFDATGLVFGVTASMTTGGHYIHLYDARNYTGGSFAELKVSNDQISAVLPDQFKNLASTPWNYMEFNGPGTKILASGNDGLTLILDGYEGTVEKSFCYNGATGAACLSNDDKSVMTGNKNGSICCWSIDNGNMIKKLDGHTGSIGCIASNPKYTLFASACTNTALWIW